MAHRFAKGYFEVVPPNLITLGMSYLHFALVSFFHDNYNKIDGKTITTNNIKSCHTHSNMLQLYQRRRHRRIDIRLLETVSSLGTCRMSSSFSCSVSCVGNSRHAVLRVVVERKSSGNTSAHAQGLGRYVHDVETRSESSRTNLAGTACLVAES